MFAAFLIMLREGIEAALIVGIIAGYLRRSGHSALLPKVWLGVLLAAVACTGIGVLIHQISGEIPQKQQELFVAIIGLIAVSVLSTMIFWMKYAAKNIVKQLHASVDKVLIRQRWQGLALIAMAFLGVAREGLESVFFLIAVFEQGQENGTLYGALLGLLSAIGVGSAIYYGSVLLNLSQFFRYTGVFIIFVAAGLLAGSLRALHEAGLWNHLQTLAFDASNILPIYSLFGVFLSGVAGYTDRPTIGEIIVWLAYLLPVLVWYLSSSLTCKGAAHA